MSAFITIRPVLSKTMHLSSYLYRVTSCANRLNCIYGTLRGISTSEVNTVNIRELRAGSLSELKLLENSLTGLGFFYISDCGISDTLLHSLRIEALGLFSISDAAKQSMHISKSKHFRGWSCVDEEVTQGVPDHKVTTIINMHFSSLINHKNWVYLFRKLSTLVWSKLLIPTLQTSGRTCGVQINGQQGILATLAKQYLPPTCRV